MRGGTFFNKKSNATRSLELKSKKAKKKKKKGKIRKNKNDRSEERRVGKEC